MMSTSTIDSGFLVNYHGIIYKCNTPVFVVNVEIPSELMFPWGVQEPTSVFKVIDIE